MSLAFLMLAHDALGCAGALAKALGANGRRVAAHIDARASAEDVVAFDKAAGEVLRVPRRPCAWGMFSLVEATLDGVQMLLDADPAITHVALVSGADAPLRPIAEFEGFLDIHPGHDVIESVELSEKRWVMDGLSEERFRLFHPFNWRTKRGLFDANVAVQRRLRVRRRYPKGLSPALGSQWWCLSRQTLERILADPQLPAIKRFFRWSWIPDESFFQTLARRHGQARIGLSPTLSRFDSRGLPFIFYDDTDSLVEQSDHFFVRKIHPRAEKLRDRLLSRAAEPAAFVEFHGKAPDEEFRRARRTRTHGRAHLISPARFPKVKGKKRLASAFPYTVIGGVGGETAEVISRELTRRGDIVCHARLFAPGEVRLHGGAALARGCLPASPQARDFWPDQFVINLARGGAGQAVAFCLAVEDREAIGDFIAKDPGAKVIWYRGAWALDLFRRAQHLDEEGAVERALAAGAAERDQLAAFRQAGAALTIRSAADLIDAPEDAVAEMLAIANARASRRSQDAPSFAPEQWRKSRPFLRTLQRSGCEVEAELVTPDGPDGEVQ